MSRLDSSDALRSSCGMIVQFADLRGQTIKKLLLIHDSCTKKHVVGDRAGHAFTEPQCACVILASVVDRLEDCGRMRLTFQRWKTRALDAGEGNRIVGKPLRAYVNRSGVCVLHTAAGRTAREMIDEGVRVERPIVHPFRSRRNNLLER